MIHALLNHAVNLDERLLFGVDLGGTKIEWVLATLKGKQLQLIQRKRVATPHTYSDILNVIAQAYRQACLEAESLSTFPVSSITYLGIGLPGSFTASGLVKNANTQCLNEQPFLADLKTLLPDDVKLFAENDANCFALAEFVLLPEEKIALCGDAVETGFGVIIGTGVGGGVILKSVHSNAGYQLLSGANGIAGEWGHNRVPVDITRVNQSARRCYCNKYDCIETYLSGSGFKQTLLELSGREGQSNSSVLNTHSVKDLYQMLEIEELSNSDSDLLKRAQALYAQQLAQCLSAVVNLIDPKTIVLGGGLSNLPKLAEQVHRYLPGHAFIHAKEERLAVQIMQNNWGDSAGVLGAALLPLIQS